MSENMNSSYLYHYTSIEVLALILKNRTIRLNPLDKLDDLQEQRTSDLNNLGRFVFVSSWTDDVDESIPMWKMYTNPLSGVRIKMRKNPFVWQGTRAEDFVSKLGCSLGGNTLPSARMKTFLNIADILSSGYFSDQAMSGSILSKIEYTNDKTLLEPKVLAITKSNFSIQLGKLGLHKNKYWEFQKEWRYIMRFIPCNFLNGPQKAFDEFQLTANKLMCGIEKPPFPYYDLQIASDCFKKMEITCSPNISVGNRVILDSLVEKYNPDAIILNSDLLGKI